MPAEATNTCTQARPHQPLPPSLPKSPAVCGVAYDQALWQLLQLSCLPLIRTLEETLTQLHRRRVVLADRQAALERQLQYQVSDLLPRTAPHLALAPLYVLASALGPALKVGRCPQQEQNGTGAADEPASLSPELVSRPSST